MALSLETAAFEKGATIAEKRMAQTQKKFEALGKKLSGVGANMSLALTAPFAAFAAKGIKEAQETAAAMAQVEAALTSMGPVAGKTAAELSKTADALEANSLFEADQILRDVTANMLTFGNVTGESFDRAQQAAVDLATRLKIGPKEAALQVGKALNDPIKGITALGRAGIQFSEDQKGMIKALVETGQVGAAQSIILDELEKQFGGAAAAAQNSDPFNKFSDALNKLAEVVGGKLLPAMIPLIEKISAGVDWFTKLPKPVQDTALVVAALSAALGPVLTVFGKILPLLIKLGPVLGIVGKAMLFIAANPAILALAGVVAAIYFAWQNWDKIKPIIDAVGAAVADWWNANVKPVFDAVMEKVKAVADFFRDYFGAQIKGAIGVVSALLKGDFSGAWEAAKQAVSGMVSAVTGLVEAFAPGVVAKMRALYQGVKTWLQDKLGGVADWLADKLGWLGDMFLKLYDRVVGHSYVPDMFDGIASEARRFDPEFVNPLVAGIGKVNSAFAGLTGASGGFGAMTPGLGVPGALEALGGAANDNADTVEAANVRIVDSFKDMAQKTLDSLGNLFDAIKGGGFLDILEGALNLGLQFASIGVFGKKIAANVNAASFGGARAMGGPVAAGRAYLVGERGPELVVPNHGGRVIPNDGLGGGGRVQRVEIVDTTGLFRFKVNGQIMEAAPGIAGAGAQMAGNQAMLSRSRRLA